MCKVFWFSVKVAFVVLLVDTVITVAAEEKENNKRQ